MTTPQGKELVRLRREARKNHINTFGQVCQFVDANFKNKIMAGLFRATVPRSQLQDAYHDVLQRAGMRIYQLRRAKKFPGWIQRISEEIAKKHRPPSIAPKDPLKQKKVSPRRPKQIGTKLIPVDGHIQKVRVFEPYKSQGPSTWRRHRFVELSDTTIMRNNKSNRPDYPTNLDVWKAVSMLPNRWAKALLLVCVEGRTAEEAARMMECKVQRIYRLVQHGKQRLRELLQQYSPQFVPQPKPQPENSALHPMN